MSTDVIKQDGPPGFREAQNRLVALLDADPSAAVLEARRLSEANNNWLLLRASILCDAGIAAGDLAAVEESAVIFARLREVKADDGRLAYNLANALAGQARLELARTSEPDWYLATSELRHRARAHFGDAAKRLVRDEPALASQALTNLGNGYDRACRWIEAFDSYEEARLAYPENGVAAGCAAQTLLRVASTGMLGHQPHLRDVGERLAAYARTHRDTVVRFAGLQVAETFDGLPSKVGPLADTRLPKRITEYQRFVAEHRLLLSPILEGLGHEPTRWDDAHIATLTERADEGDACVPPVFAVFNVMKADYLVARDLLFQATREMEHHTRRDTGVYMDTLDYAVYGVAPSRLVLAQRAALDVLDKIAVAVNELLGVGLRPNAIHFASFWRLSKKDPRWRPQLASAIGRGNVALIALSEIAADLSDADAVHDVGPGVLNEHRKTRNAGTHRFVVLHDFGIGHSRPSTAIEHIDLVTFQDIAVRTLRLARAALLHFLEAVAYGERAKKGSGRLTADMLIRPHHEIRGT